VTRISVLKLKVFYSMQENWSQREHSWQGNWKSVGTCKRPWSWRNWWGCWNQNCNGAAILTKVMAKTSAVSLFVCSRISHTCFFYTVASYYIFYTTRVKPRFHIVVGTTYNGMKSGEHSYGNLAMILHKIVNNAKCGNVKPGVYCVYNYGSNNVRCVMLCQRRNHFL
jgi:hypothetical protein